MRDHRVGDVGQKIDGKAELDSAETLVRRQSSSMVNNDNRNEAVLVEVGSG